MALAPIEPQSSPKPHKFSNFVGENYELALNQSIPNLLDSLRTPSFDLSIFASTFNELMQAKVNPPLEVIWVYSALTFRSNNSAKDDPLNRLTVIREIFQLISACSASVSCSKSIVLIAPVIYEVYRLIVDLKAKDLGRKREKKVKIEVKSLVNVILGYISLCCCEDSNDEDMLGLDSDDLIRPLEDLVCVWIGDQVDANSGGKDGFRLFFPLVTDEITERLSKGECEVSELAGVVIAEAFLLRLCLDFHVGIERLELEKELRNWIVGSMSGFRNFYFFETLVRMLLEPTLPISSLLKSEDEIFLRKILYDAVVLVDYSFVNPERVIHVPAKNMRSLAIARLMVTHEAIELFREDGNQTKAISYINAFSRSHLPSQLIKWFTSEIGKEGKASRPKGSSPKALLKWLLNLENQGIKSLDDGISKWCAKVDFSKADYEQLAYNAEGDKSAGDLFYIDNKGEMEIGNVGDEQMNESMSAAFVAAAQTMTPDENGRRRKRKERKNIEKKKQVKFLKYNLYDNSGSSGDKFTLSKDASNSESDVENPLSDEDVAVNE
ncbi:uncharacterized protein LOC132277125 [Cornus florida]|uniref:uncharacterized protein LOC132277125 n=1 Tax=Cornus florida TaxID=4283 RepID=UPI002898FAA5|nr:uncharacterized protein LOC132277125 [Cornus florida]